MTIVSVFMVVALTAVGFAAWLITGTIDYKAEGSFVANELEDKYFKVEVEFDAHITDDKDTADVNEARNNGKVIFGRPGDDVTMSDKAWLSYSSEDEAEKLTVVATVKFIPDDGFYRPAQGEDATTKDMAYYLLDSQVIDEETGTITSKTYRTIRVKIDIAELLDDNGNIKAGSDQFKWYDWAYQLGYISYPKAHLVELDEQNKEITYENSTNQLKWVSNNTVEMEEPVILNDNSTAQDQKGNTVLVGKNKFQFGYLCLDLTYDMFEIQYESETAKEAKVATAKVNITFDWGTAMECELEIDGETQTVNANPYTYFALDDNKPENTVDVLNYLKVTPQTGYSSYDFLETAECQDDPETEEDEDTDHSDDKTIRNKDLAQRMLDYIRDYLNYTPADPSNGTSASGIQFIFEVLEGKPQVVNTAQSSGN